MGIGVGPVFTNAGTNETFARTTTIFSFDVGWGAGGSIQIAAGDKGVTSVSFTMGPGYGLAFTKIDTVTSIRENE